MATITVFDPTTRHTRAISATIESSPIIQDLTGQIEFFLKLSTSAKDVNGSDIPNRTVRKLSDGAGGTGLDRHGNPLPDGKYANLTDAIRDYVAMMVNGVDGEPWTEMDFS
jgi:hypothetical protein